MQMFGVMWITPSLPLLPGSLWPGVVALEGVNLRVKWNCLIFKLSENK